MIDPSSLVRVFLRAGVPAVVASRWRVDSEASAKVMDLFYARLFQGESVAAALAHAEKDMRSNPVYSHPYFWSGFSTYGS
jgi:CHAT domain-containing protein